MLLTRDSLITQSSLPNWVCKQLLRDHLLRQGLLWGMVLGGHWSLQDKFGAVFHFLEPLGPYVSGKQQRRSMVGKSYQMCRGAGTDGCPGAGGIQMPHGSTAGEEGRPADGEEGFDLLDPPGAW